MRDTLNTGVHCRVKPADFLKTTKPRIILRSLCKFIDYVVKDPEFFEWFNDRGFVLNPKLRSGSDIRKMLLNFVYTKVVQVSSDITQAVKSKQRELEWDKYYWIGVQIRTGKMIGDEGRNVFMFKDDLKMFTMHALNQTEKAKLAQKKPVKWLVTTDSEDVRKLIQRDYPEYYVNTNCLLAHSFRDVQKQERTDGMMCSLLENYLLSEVNEAVVTAQSTYGLLAAYRNLYIKKIMVYRGDWKKYQKMKF